jgi:WXG100 family type VII secretion target
MSEISVNFPLMEQGAADLRAASSALQNVLDQLRSDSANLVHSWVGSGSSSGAAWQAVDQDMQSTIDGLSQYATTFGNKVETASTSQRHTEAQIGNMFA